MILHGPASQAVTKLQDAGQTDGRKMLLQGSLICTSLRSGVD